MYVVASGQGAEVGAVHPAVSRARQVQGAQVGASQGPADGRAVGGLDPDRQARCGQGGCPETEVELGRLYQDAQGGELGQEQRRRRAAEWAEWDSAGRPVAEPVPDPDRWQCGN